jgi:hypothetical protein
MGSIFKASPASILNKKPPKRQYIIFCKPSSRLAKLRAQSYHKAYPKVSQNAQHQYMHVPQSFPFRSLPLFPFHCHPLFTFILSLQSPSILRHPSLTRLSYSGLCSLHIFAASTFAGLSSFGSANILITLINIFSTLCIGDQRSDACS